MSEFRRLASATRCAAPPVDAACVSERQLLAHDELVERRFWSELRAGVGVQANLYGADMLGSLFDERCATFNLRRLDSLLQLLPEPVAGVNVRARARASRSTTSRVSIVDVAGRLRIFTLARGAHSSRGTSKTWTSSVESVRTRLTRSPFTDARRRRRRRTRQASTICTLARPRRGSASAPTLPTCLNRARSTSSRWKRKYERSTRLWSSPTSPCFFFVVFRLGRAVLRRVPAAQELADCAERAGGVQRRRAAHRAAAGRVCRHAAARLPRWLQPRLQLRRGGELCRRAGRFSSSAASLLSVSFSSRGRGCRAVARVWRTRARLRVQRQRRLDRHESAPSARTRAVQLLVA